MALSVTVYAIEAKVHGYNGIDDEIGCRVSAYENPVLIVTNLDKITCEPCRIALIKEEFR
jgi:hypothetical protein